MVDYASRSLLLTFHWDLGQGMLLDEVEGTSLAANVHRSLLSPVQAQQQTVRLQLDLVDRVCEMPSISNHHLRPNRPPLLTLAEFILIGSRSCNSNSL